MESPVSIIGMERKVELAIRANDLLSPGDSIVLAVSGGPDSVALFRCLIALRIRWNWDVSVGHIDHGFRGKESDGDAKFVEALATKFGVPVMVSRLHLNKHDAKMHKQSLQEYARAVRYHALEEMVQHRNATKLAFGHTADDQAETVLMWMLRGCGTGGLGGMPPKRGSHVIRPLLNIQRSEIVEYLKERQQDFQMDSTNLQQVYLRNRIRLDLIPQLKKYSLGIVNVLNRQAQILGDDHAYLEELTDGAFHRTCVSKSTGERQFDRVALLGLPLPIRRRVIRQSFQQVGKNSQSPRFDVVERVLNRLEHGQSGWTIDCHGVRLGQEYDRLVVRCPEALNQATAVFSNMKVEPLPIPGEVTWSPTGHRITISMTTPAVIGDHLHSPSEIYLDPATFTPELTLRSWIPGDIFCPKGLGGRQKKLQDFFSDLKLPRSQRIKVPLLVAPEGIVWVGGLRADERFQVSASTTSVVVAKMIN